MVDIMHYKPLKVRLESQIMHKKTNKKMHQRVK